MGETRAQRDQRLRRELLERRRQQARARARLIAVRRRITRILRALRRPRMVARPAERIVTDVANQSSRTAAIKLIVLHDTEGANVPGVADLQGLAAWFNNPDSQASAHVGVDAEGNAAQYVPDARKAWHVAQFNSVALGIEQIGFAAQASWPQAQLRTVAQYVAHWSQRYGIPLVHSTSHGVCEHKDLGVAGGGHSDCGPNYPFERVLATAREITRKGA